jgi:hypothetical protein
MMLMLMMLAASYAAAQENNSANTANMTQHDNTPRETDTSHANTTRETDTSQDSISIDCCDLYDLLTSYTVQTTGDKVDKSVCLHDECLTLKLIQLFVNHTRSMLDEKLPSSSKHIVSVRTTATHIEIMRSAFLQETKKVLVLALLGRASLPDNLRHQHISLEYDTGLDTLSVRDSACAIDKTIYSTIVVASISLLVFFIATQVVEDDNRKNQESAKMPTVGSNPVGKGVHAAAMKPSSMFRIRVHP